MSEKPPKKTLDAIRESCVFWWQYHYPDHSFQLIAESPRSAKAPPVTQVVYATDSRAKAAQFSRVVLRLGGKAVHEAFNDLKIIAAFLPSS